MTASRAWLAGSAALAVATYVLLWIGYAQRWNWLATLDASALEPMYRYGSAHPGWVAAWAGVCTVLGPVAFRLATLVVIVVALVRRRRRAAVFLLISVEVSGLVADAAKFLVDRPRPTTALVAAFASSFPSGHAFGVLVSVLALSTLGLPHARSSLRPWLVALGAVVVIAIGVGRVALNVHRPSDVLAGWALGYAYFAVCLLVVPPTRRVRQADEIPAAPGSRR